jgi:hypothetical protein
MLFEDAVRANAMAVKQASIPDLRRLLPVLRQAEGDLSRELGRWLKRRSPDETYDKHRHRALVAQLREAIGESERRIGPALAEDVDHQAHDTRAVAAGHLRSMVEAGSAQYEGAIRPLRVDVAAILADEDQLLLTKMRAKGARYSADVVGDINNRLALSVLRGETVDQMTSRLLQSTGLVRAFKERGPAAVGEGIAGQWGRKYKWWAESIARTELVNAYAESQVRALREANGEDPGWVLRWDAANDWRTCWLCRSLDKSTAEPDQSFRAVGRFGARPHPPLHSCCRCGVFPWRRSWSNKQGN